MTENKIDSGLVALVACAKYLGVPADLEQMQRAYITDCERLSVVELIRAARGLSLRSKGLIYKDKLLNNITFPAILQLADNSFVALLGVQGEKAIIYEPNKRERFVVEIENLRANWNGQVVLLARRFKLKEIERKFGIAWMVPLIAKYKRMFGQVLFLSLILQLFTIVTPIFSQVIIDKVLVHRSLNTLGIMCIAMLVAGLFNLWVTGLRSLLFSHTTNKVDVTLSSKMFKHIAALPLRYFEKWQVGEIVSRVRELESIREFITGSSLTIVLDIVFAVICIIVMFVYSPTLSVIALLALPLYIILSLTAAPMYQRRLNQQFYAGAENQSFMIEAVTGIQTVKALTVEKNFAQRYEESLARLLKASFSTAFLALVAGNIGNYVQMVSTLAILWVGAQEVLSDKISVGELIAFNMLSGQVSAPILRLVNMWQYFQKTKVAIDRVGDVMNEETEPEFNPTRTTLPTLMGGVVLDKVHFKYKDDGIEVLNDISLAVDAGMKVGVVGRSGSGKSTLTKILQRFYVPNRGRVLIDGVDLSQVEPAWLRRQIGVVLQESMLFDGSIRDNIAMAEPYATQENIVRAAQMAGAHDFIAKLSKGYNTEVGERGSLLSGGQRQRIAIARALMTNPRIIIFDEATSALDYESENIIMKNLDVITKGRTMFMIAHRLSTVCNCDLIVVLDRGRIVEQGTHKELLDLGGYYFRLYQQQSM